MDVGSQPHVVGQIPAIVIRIVVEDDVVIIPIPVIAIADVEGCDAEIVSAEPEAARTTAPKTPDMAASDGEREVAVLPGMVKMEAGVVASGVMSYPAVVGMNVRGLGMAGLVTEGLVLFRLLLFWMLLFRMCGRGRARFRLGSPLHGAVIGLRATAGKYSLRQRPVGRLPRDFRAERERAKTTKATVQQ